MKKIILFIVGVIIVSCNHNQSNQKFEKNLELAKQWFEKWEAEDINALSDMISEEVEWQGAFYGQPLITNKSGLIDYINGWIGAMENINYEANTFLPGHNPETGLPDGSVRTYGTWTGKNTASGIDFKVLFYHYLNFDENGMVTEGGDFGDATGTVVAVSQKTE